MKLLISPRNESTSVPRLLIVALGEPARMQFADNVQCLFDISLTEGRHVGEHILAIRMYFRCANVIGM